MTREPNEILSAFLDGEAVEDLALAEALAAPGGRETLVDFVLLRGAMTSAADRPGAEFYKNMDALLEPQARKRPWRTLAAAAAVVAFLALGVWSLRPTETVQIDPPTPAPEASRTLHFERGVDWEGQG
ncbi:MAG: hypothetical protein OEV00_01135 [Acidobacteriota bacterium]|nr:hypothetical protein [Acidobacteriota bacterium]MDH3783909.1 hypothetical protein [Acidobacteriota bacterium]